MNDITEIILEGLAVVLAGAALAVGGQVLRDAWKGAFSAPGERPRGTAAESGKR